MNRGAPLALAVVVLAGGCRPVEEVREYFREPTPHEAYRLGLSHAGLAHTALGEDWVRSSETALFRPVRVEPPFLEEGYFPPDEASALGYRFTLRRGQALRVQVEVKGPPSGRVFVDLFRAAPDSTRFPVPILSGEAGSEMVLEPRRSGDYLLRVQPELLRGGRFQVSIMMQPALGFPVSGRTSSAILSFFGAERDGGRRQHHGVDIFAPRGTPVVAVSEATVRRVDTTAIGGRVIWLRDEARNASLYYAHLEKPLVREGARVRPGDTIGLVGNTGNARTTPPHLHFGIYVRREGPVDPWAFIAELPQEAPLPVVDGESLGRWVRTHGMDVPLVDRPGARGTEVASLLPHSALRVMGGVGEWYRVRLPDGGHGFVAAAATEGLDVPLRMERIAGSRDLRSHPLEGAPVVARLEDPQELPVLGAYGAYLYVLGPGGRAGWMASDREE